MRKGRLGRVVLGALLLGAGLAVVPILPEESASATLSGMPPGFVDEVVVGGLPFPTAIAFTPDETMLIALKAGIVRVYRNGQLLPTPFINISSRVHDNHDRGLLEHHRPSRLPPPAVRVPAVHARPHRGVPR